MPSLICSIRRCAGVSFVTLLLRTDHRARIRIANLLDGPVWPPRVDGRVRAGWDVAGATVVVDPGVTPLGYASPATPIDPPAAIISSDRATRSDPADASQPPAAPTDRAATTHPWFEAVADRLDRAETIATADGLEEAATAVADAGGLAGVQELAAALDRDRRLLDQVPSAPAELTARVEDVSIPTEPIARLVRAGYSSTGCASRRS